MALYETTKETPIGEVIAWRTDRGLVALGFLDGIGALRLSLERRFEGAPVVADPSPEVGDAVEYYFSGSTGALDDLAVDLYGTDLQMRIWEALRRVPAGTTASYGELAAEVTTSPRVVGNAMAANPVCLALPCHRVIRSDGSWNGYAYGNDRKRWLLEHEGRATGIRNAERVKPARRIAS